MAIAGIQRDIVISSACKYMVKCDGEVNGKTESVDIASTDKEARLRGEDALRKRDILYKHRVSSLLWDTPVLVFPFFVDYSLNRPTKMSVFATDGRRSNEQ